MRWREAAKVFSFTKDSKVIFIQKTLLRCGGYFLIEVILGFSRAPALKHAWLKKYRQIFEESDSKKLSLLKNF